MSEELDVNKAAAETVVALTEATGALEPAQNFWAALARRIDYYFYPRTVRLAQKAAEQIESSGLPVCAYEAIREHDALLGAILEGGSMEGDEDMGDRWANLLANALTSESPEVRIAFPRILGDLEPAEARLLDRLADNKGAERIPPQWAMTQFAVTATDLDNLERLELIRYQLLHAPSFDDMADLSSASREAFTITRLGHAFVRACRSAKQDD